MKKCCECKEVKDFVNFSKSSYSKDGFNYKCNSCNNLYNAKRRERIRKLRLENKEIRHCNVCKQNKLIGYFLDSKEKEICDACLHKEWLLKHKEEEKERMRIYNLQNKERNIIKRQAEQHSPHNLFIFLKARAREGKKDFDFTEESFTKWYLEQPKSCYYCQRPTEECLKDRLAKGIKRLTFERRNNSLGYVQGNVKMICYYCNSLKSDIYTEEDMLMILGPITKLRLRQLAEKRALMQGGTNA
jgi:hypothetical protein